MASSSSVKRRKNTSPSSPAEEIPHLDGDRLLPLPPVISAARRPPPLPASSIERQRASRRSSSLSGPLVSSNDPTVVPTTPFLVPLPKPAVTVSRSNYLNKEKIEKRQKEQHVMAEVTVVYRSVVLLILIAVIFYYEYRWMVVLVSEIAPVSCLFLYLWSSHIVQFWLDRPVTEDVSVFVFIWCLVICIVGCTVGVMISPVAAMVITTLAAICMSTFFVLTLHEYLHTRPACCLSEGGDSFRSAVAQEVNVKKRSRSREAGVPRPVKPWK